MSDTTTPTTFAEAEAVLAETLPGYEPRPQQQRLAKEVEEALASGDHLVAEAGCGTGKSIGYLIPVILSGKTAVVTTATKALQDQIANKDLPFLAEHLGVDFTSAVLKGRSNYLCQAKAVDSGLPVVEEVQVHIKGLQGTGETWNGERENLPFEVEDRDWRALTASSDECPGKRDCPFGETCYAEKAKDVARESDVVVVNHALFFTDLMVREMTGGNATMLPPYEVVVADEAHELEEWASNMLGSKFSAYTVKNMTGEARSFLQTHFGPDDPERVRGEEAIASLSEASDALWSALDTNRPEAKRGRPPVTSWRIRPGLLMTIDGTATEVGDTMVNLANTLGSYAEVIGSLRIGSGGDEAGAVRKKKMLATKATNATMRFADVVRQSLSPDPGLVAWVSEETLRRGDKRLVIESAPIEVGAILDQMVWSKTQGILVSATMSVRGSFDYIGQRLGLSDFTGLDVGTPFDYATQSALYVPKDLPNPSRERAAWEGQSVFQMGELVRASKGRALLLFTSRKQMQAAYETLADRLPYTCLMQGQGSNQALAAEFMADESSVLFALRSFFTGVDFQGEACSLVVIDKLPFPVPTEPVVEARCEKIVARGGNDFTEYTVPVMSLILQQGFGRLIRHREDTGVVAILDPRLVNSGYGSTIMNSLPPSRRLRDLHEVGAFFEEVGA